MSDRLRDMGRTEEVQLVDAAPIESSPSETFEAERGTGGLRLLEVLEDIENGFFDEMDNQPGWIDGPDEALYAATNFPVITRYLMRPVMKYPLDETTYAELWLGGDRVEICETMTCVVTGGAQKARTCGDALPTDLVLRSSGYGPNYVLACAERAEQGEASV